MYTIRQIGILISYKMLNDWKESQAKTIDFADIAKANSLDAQKAILAMATPSERAKISAKISALSWGTNANKAWRETIQSEIKRLDIPVSIVPAEPKSLAAQAWVEPKTQPTLVDSQNRANEAIVSAHDNEAKVIKVISKNGQVTVMDDVAKTGSQSKTEKYKDEAVKIEYTKEGKLTREAMIGLLSDLDGMSGTERTNRGWLRRTFFGGGEQKEVIGEQQIKKLLATKSTQELDAIYARITGNTEGLPWKMERKTLNDHQSYQNSIYDYNHQDRAKITRFQEELVAQADVMADAMSIVLNDGKARSGLVAVLEGRTGELQTALNIPQNQKAFKELLAKSGVLNREPQFLEKMVSALLRIGVLVPFSIMSGGTIGGYMEQGKLDIENGKLSKDGMSLTAKTGVGKEGSVAGSLDVVGARLEANWNDPEMRIANRLAAVTEAKDKKKAISDLVARIDSESAPKKGESPTDASRKVAELGNAFVRAQAPIHALPDSQLKSDALAQNTLIYLAKVDKARGFELKGAFAAATLSGWMVGLSGAMTDTSASFDGLKTNAAVIEATGLSPKSLTDANSAEYLEKAGIVKNTAGNYIIDGKEIVLSPGQAIQWHFTRLYTDLDVTTTATYQIVSGSKSVSSDVVTKFSNPEASNTYIEKNSKKMADLMKELRKSNSGFTRFEELASSGQYDKALDAIFKLVQSKADGDLISAIGNLNTLAQKKSFIDMLLAKTSGSDASRKLGNEIIEGKNNIDAVRTYFAWIARAFKGQYGVDAQAQFDAIAKNGLSQKDIKTIGEYAKKGFHGMVAYNQKNAGKGFVKIDKVDHKNAQIIWTPAEVTGADAAKIRELAKGNITTVELTAYKKENPTAVKGLNDATIKNMMVGGKVSSYLSFEKDAACFNLWFIVEPGSGTRTTEGVPAKSKATLSEGALVGIPEAGLFSAGVGIGWEWDKPKPEKEDTTPEPTPEPTPTKPNKPNPRPPEKPVTNTPTPVTTPGETPQVPITQSPGAPAPAPAAPAQPAPAPIAVEVTPPVWSPAPAIK